MFSKKIARMVSVLIVLLVVVIMGVIGVYLGYNYVISQTERFDVLAAQIKSGDLLIDQMTPDSVMIVIESGDDTAVIAKKLQVNGLVDNTLMFTLMSKFNGFDGGYQVGTHFLTKDLSYDEMMYMLCQKPEVIKITFPEGLTYEEIKALLTKSGVNYDTEKLDELMDSPNVFVDYRFVSAIEIDEARDYVLNGYLFPDTYYFDINVTEEEIIQTFLRNMNNKLYDEFYDRAEKIGMTMDQVFVLASLIQSETTDQYDMLLISAVFHNRLKTDDIGLQKLGSCATINFLREKEGLPTVWAATPSDVLRDSPYNTYMYPGLPPGPICMPGIDAIWAALYPETKQEKLFYFCATGIDGGTAFASTLAEHEKNVLKYQENWNDNPTPAVTSEASDPDA